MIATVHEFDGMVVSVYQMEAGEAITRHSHPFAHSTSVALGSTEVEVYGVETFVMRRGSKDRILPAEIEHEIRAIQDGTIVVNIHRAPVPGVDGATGGIIFEDAA